MSKKQKKSPDSHQQCLELIRSALDKTRRGELVFHLPRPVGIRQPISGGHFHSQPEFFFHISGKIRLKFPESKLTLNAGEVLMIPSWLAHSERSPCYKQTLTMVVAMNLSEISWHFAKTITPSSYETFGSHYISSPKANTLIKMCEELTHLRRDSSRYDRFVGNAMTVSILHLMEDIISAGGKQPDSVNHKVSSCRQLINSNLANPNLNVQYLAGRLGCNADYLSHLFMENAGVPLTEFINTRRIQVAINLLNSENMNISEVAYACGYSDPGYFSRMFRKLTGKSPAEFRKQPVNSRF